MKFLVDAHLPPGLCALLRAAGHDALHTREFPAQNQTPDEVINNLSLKDQRVVVSKDTDFSTPICCTRSPGNCCLFALGT